MKIVCGKTILSESISIVSRAASNRTTLPILECILLSANYEKGFKLLANDLEMGIETKPIMAEISEPGDIALDARVFFDIVRRLPGDDVYIETMNNYVTKIKSGVSEFKILGQPGDEFPLLPEVETETGFDIPSGTLKNMIRQTIFSVSVDESKPAITGELFSAENGRFRMVSLDGFRISIRTEDISNKELSFSSIVPGKTLGEIYKILQQSEKSFTSVYFSEKHVLFETEYATVVSRLIDGKFLDLDNLFLTDCTTYMMVNNKELLGCLERAALISRETKKSPVKLTVDKENERLVVESNTETGTFYEVIQAEIDGLDLEIVFNPRFLTDVLKAIDDDKVRLQFTTPLSPCIIKSVENEDYKYLVLPTRLMG